VHDELRALLEGSKLWEEDGPRQIQDFLSPRDGAENLAALRLVLDQYTPVLEGFANSNHGSPVVDVAERKLISVPDFDTTQVTLGLDSLRQALGMVVTASNSRGLKMLSKPFTDLDSGLTEGDPNQFNGIYTRNITYLMTSLQRDALVNTDPVMDLTESYMAEGDEDYSPAFPNSALLGLDLVDRAEKVMTLEALIGAVAVERRVSSGELQQADVPANLRGLQAGIHGTVTPRDPRRRALRPRAASRLLREPVSNRLSSLCPVTRHPVRDRRPEPSGSRRQPQRPQYKALGEQLQRSPTCHSQCA